MYRSLMVACESVNLLDPLHSVCWQTSPLTLLLLLSSDHSSLHQLHVHYYQSHLPHSESVVSVWDDMLMIVGDFCHDVVRVKRVRGSWPLTHHLRCNCSSADCAKLRLISVWCWVMSGEYWTYDAYSAVGGCYSMISAAERENILTVVVSSRVYSAIAVYSFPSCFLVIKHKIDIQLR